MLYTASYFEATHQHGRLVSISRSVPNGFRIDDKLQFFAPSTDLLANCQAKKIDEAGYIEQYRTQSHRILAVGQGLA